MTELAPGVMCEIVPAKCAPDTLQPFVGMRCLALGPEPIIDLLRVLTGGVMHEHWSVELDNGLTLTLCRSCLRPIEPPREDDATWARIREITGWTPAKEAA